MVIVSPYAQAAVRRPHDGARSPRCWRSPSTCSACRRCPRRTPTRTTTANAFDFGQRAAAADPAPAAPGAALVAAVHGRAPAGSERPHVTGRSLTRRRRTSTQNHCPFARATKRIAPHGARTQNREQSPRTHRLLLDHQGIDHGDGRDHFRLLHPSCRCEQHAGLATIGSSRVSPWRSHLRCSSRTGGTWPGSTGSPS